MAAIIRPHTSLKSIPRVSKRLFRRVIKKTRVLLRGRQKYRLAICSMFRDEAKYLEEWITFHIREGVQHIYLYNDESTDDFQSVLKPWIEKGVVTLREANNRIQQEIFNDFIKNERKNVDWIAFIDIDEFLYTSDESSLVEKLEEYEPFSGIYVFWRVFGSSGLSANSSAGVIEDCRYTLPYDLSSAEMREKWLTWLSLRGSSRLTGNPIQGKSLVRSRYVQSMEVHRPTKYRGRFCDVAKNEIDPRNINEACFNGTYSAVTDQIMINHYWGRSIDAIDQKFTLPGASSWARSPSLATPKLSTALEWNAILTESEDLSLVHRVRRRSFPYIFCLGFNKTGTSSLAHFFTENGLPAVHWDFNKLVQQMVENLKSGLPIMAGYDNSFRVFTDMILADDAQIVEGNGYFREMERDYPNSFFILNNRPTANWIKSRSLHGNGNFLKRQLKLLNSENPEDAFTLWREQKASHEADVRDFFKGNKRFLEIDIESDDVPEKISGLLGITLDRSKWLALNRTIDRNVQMAN